MTTPRRCLTRRGRLETAFALRRSSWNSESRSVSANCHRRQRIDPPGARADQARRRHERARQLQHRLHVRAASASPRSPAAAPPRRSPPPPPCSSPTTACSAFAPVARHVPLGIRRRQIRPGRLRRHDVAARRHQVRLHAPGRTASARASCTPPPCRPTAAPSRACRPRRPSSRTGSLPGDVIAAEHRPAVRRLPVVARRRHDDDARPRTARSTASHSGSSRYGCSTGAPSDRLMTRMLYSLAVLDRPVDRLDHVARRPRPVVAQHPQVDQIRARRDAAVVARLGRPARPAPAMIAATCVPWPNRSTPSPPVKSTRDAARGRLSALCRASIPESITATVDRRCPVSAGTPSGARPHLIGADRSRAVTSPPTTGSGCRPTGDRPPSSCCSASSWPAFTRSTAPLLQHASRSAGCSARRARRPPPASPWTMTSIVCEPAAR